MLKDSEINSLTLEKVVQHVAPNMHAHPYRIAKYCYPEVFKKMEEFSEKIKSGGIGKDEREQQSIDGYDNTDKYLVAHAPVGVDIREMMEDYREHRHEMNVKILIGDKTPKAMLKSIQRDEFTATAYFTYEWWSANKPFDKQIDLMGYIDTVRDAYRLTPIFAPHDVTEKEVKRILKMKQFK